MFPATPDQQNIPVKMSSLMQWLIPGRCLLCRIPSTANLCAGCEADLPVMGRACQRCGIPLAEEAVGIGSMSDSDVLCGSCIVRPPAFDDTVAALEYAFPVPVLVQRFKFSRSLACGAVLADHMLRALRWHGATADLIVPVPLHRTRQFRRVYNQAEVLAYDLGKWMGIRVSPRTLRRERRTPAQSGLSATQRRVNLRGAFAARAVDARHVALVDDVMTTGSTAAECARVLKGAGAAQVSLWVAARAV